ncbi:PPOX class F420-dependent oxidoreductase [Kribbella sp. NPDC055071]
MLDPKIRAVLDGAAFAHLATILPDGSPHSTPVYAGTRGDQIVIFTGPTMRKARNLRADPRLALSIVPADNPFEPITIRGHVTEWIEGDEAWEIIDPLVAKYIDLKYARDQERHVIVIEPDHQKVGM